MTLTSIPGSKNTVLLSTPFTLGVSPSCLNFLAVCGDVDMDLSALVTEDNPHIQISVREDNPHTDE